MTELRDRSAAPGRASSPWRARLRAVSPDTWGMVLVAAVVIAANLPYLLGISDINPLGPRSSLVVAQTLGPAGGQPTIDPNNGFISQAVSHRAALDLLHLQLPWWNPFEGTGVPLAGAMQPAAFFPPTTTRTTAISARTAGRSSGRATSPGRACRSCCSRTSTARSSTTPT